MLHRDRGASQAAANGSQKLVGTFDRLAFHAQDDVAILKVGVVGRASGDRVLQDDGIYCSGGRVGSESATCSPMTR